MTYTSIRTPCPSELGPILNETWESLSLSSHGIRIGLLRSFRLSAKSSNIRALTNLWSFLDTVHERLLFHIFLYGLNEMFISKTVLQGFFSGPRTISSWHIARETKTGSILRCREDGVQWAYTSCFFLLSVEIVHSPWQHHSNAATSKFLFFPNLLSSNI
jgi:hypothetical protein